MVALGASTGLGSMGSTLAGGGELALRPRATCIGVASMRERVAELGGVIDFATGVLGSGLVINALLPVESL